MTSVHGCYTGWLATEIQAATKRRENRMLFSPCAIATAARFCRLEARKDHAFGSEPIFQPQQR